MRRKALDLDGMDRRIVNALQDGLPLVERPYAQVAAALEMTEDALITRIKSLLARGALTRFGPFFDAKALGGEFCLCAMAVPEDRFDSVAAQVNAHPEVAHNYARAHRLNMWFVLAVERPDQIAASAAAIEAETGLAVLCFPKQEEYFIGFRVAA